MLREASLLRKWPTRTSSRGAGSKQPIEAHEHWHVDIIYANVCGTFLYLLSVLDGFSRAIVHHEMRTSMTQADVQIVVQRAPERFPEARPRIISDNGPQFIARDIKSYVWQMGMDHVKTSPYYPASNGKIERYHRTLKNECIRPKTPLTLDEARRLVDEFVRCYNERRLHSAIGYVTPMDKFLRRDKVIFQERDRKIEAARERRAIARRAAPPTSNQKQRTENSSSR